VLTTAGAVKCWGDNSRGQLGNGYSPSQTSPVEVIGLSSGVVAIALGDGHTCALTGGGAAKCWGRNLEGQLGNGTRADRTTPDDVVGLPSGVAAIAAGGTVTCALTAAGGAKCWGGNNYGQVGNGTGGVYGNGADQLTPVDVVGLANGVAALAVGGAHACALTTGGAVKCWGYNSYGQVGNGGNDTSQLTPANVVGLASGVAAIAAGAYHTCALTSGGGVRCWGLNSSGQLGDGNPGAFKQLTPVDVIGLASGVAAIAAGAYHTCALTTGGAVKCWGSNYYRELGNGGTASQSTPVDVIGLAGGVAKIVTYGSHTCALTAGGAVKCWGWNVLGQLGNGDTVDRSAPVDVIGLAGGVAAIGVGLAHTCALGMGGGLKCWGAKGRGQLGNGEADYSLVPVNVAIASDTVPVPFSFTAQTDVAVGSVRTSNAIVPVGYDSAAPISVANGEYSLGCIGTFTMAAGTINPGQSVCVRHTASISPGTTVTTTLTIGGVNGSFGSTTASAAPDTTPDPFGFTAQTGVAAGSVRTSNAITPVGYDAETVITVSNGEYSIGCAASFTSAADMLTPGESVCVRHTASMSPSTTVTTTLTIGGVDGAFSSTTAGVMAPPLSFAPNPLDFDGQSMFTRSLKRQVTISNVAGSALTLNALATDGPFAIASHTCGTLPAQLPAGGSCTAELTFTPPDEGPFAGSLDAATSAGDASGALMGTGERSLVVHYYGSILNRYPEPSGKTYWNSEAARVQALGADLNEVWYALAMGFFNSVEYIGFGRTDGEFIDDLYRTFLNREPEDAGRDFWLGLIAQGLTREVVLVWFMFSDEFRVFTSSIFGNTAVRKELDAVMDFYRGLLLRLPDGGGFNFWVQRFRAAQCAGPAAVTAEAEAISGEFARGAEYASRNRSNSEYVGDLYNAILRRGGDGPGVQYWIGSIASGALTREQVRQQFVQSPEFQGRVAQIIAAGCLPP
jgi:alpha-tubulin suppressor-like RCC1 family protein/predicted thioesterase